MVSMISPRKSSVIRSALTSPKYRRLDWMKNGRKRKTIQPVVRRRKTDVSTPLLGYLFSFTQPSPTTSTPATVPSATSNANEEELVNQQTQARCDQWTTSYNNAVT